MERLVKDLWSGCDVPGLSVIASVGGRRVGESHGVLTAGTSQAMSQEAYFDISCLMKLFISVIASRFVEAGSLCWNAPLERYLPELSGSRVGSNIVVANLLSHTAGYRGLDVLSARVKWAQSWSDTVRSLNLNEPLYPPGRVFSYEHLDHVLAGEILCRIAGVEVEQLLDDHLLKLVGVSARSGRDAAELGAVVTSHVRPRDGGAFEPASLPAFGSFWRCSLPDLKMRLPDVLSVADWMMRDPSVARCMQGQVIDLPRQIVGGEYPEEIPRSFGLICGEYSGGQFGHNGSSFGQAIGLRIWPQTRTAVAVGLNAWVPHLRDRVLGEAVNALNPTCTWTSPNWDREAVLQFAPAELAGCYVGGFASEVYVTQRDEDNLELLVGGKLGRARRILVEHGRSGLMRLSKDETASIAIEPHPTDGSPVLHIGMYAYRKRRN